ncbi:ketosteroid isomerase-related protein [Pseudomarimonas salicorniae]|uniref:Nuclear transport factor 2 family protein n=1 Tax=Pseudomarimonas salicorniae TaxID=2933270 RepID=A0ABT0GCY0_9GAMM|nr:ketosteroid isomerase-related protein [Lysobacter sp. CAU 1642]MCK7592391.1 nuclear transport factor 2 family protein [Lysobacter sp. CAU 1642]
MSHDATPARDRILDYYAAFNRGDADAMLACLAPDVVHDINQGGRETGREAFAAFLARMARCYREQLHDIVVMVSDDGSRAAAEYIVEGEYLSDDEGLPPAQGQHYRIPGGAFFELGATGIRRVSNYYNLSEWIAQVEGRARPAG